MDRQTEIIFEERKEAIKSFLARPPQNKNEWNDGMEWKSVLLNGLYQVSGCSSHNVMESRLYRMTVGAHGTAAQQPLPTEGGTGKAKLHHLLFMTNFGCG